MDCWGRGSYVNHPELPLDNAVTMINMDMIGRVRESRIYVDGTSTGTMLRRDTEAVARRSGLRVELSGSSTYGSSDHMTFTAAQVPALLFFSGLHADYHKPSDTWDKINSNGAVDVLQLIADLLDRISVQPERPEFIRIRRNTASPE